MTRRARPAAAALGLLTVIAAAPARAAPVELDVSGCDDADALQAAARVELAGAEPAVGRVAVICLDATRVLIVAFPRDGRRPGAREVAFDDVVIASRARAVAIALAELVREPPEAGAPPLPLPPAALPPPVPPPAPGWGDDALQRAPVVVLWAPPSVPPAIPRPVAARWTAGASLRQRASTSTGTIVIGPDVELDVPIGDDGLRLRGGAHLGLAGADRPVGSAGITTWTGSVSLLLRGGGEALLLDAGPVVEGGVATAHGTPASGVPVESTTTTSPLVLAGGQVVLGARLGRLLVPFVAVDGGAVIAGVAADVDGDRVLGIGGAFLGTRVGLAIGPARSRRGLE